MINVAIFDVDGTLKVPDEPVELGVVNRVHDLVEDDIHISLVSGKGAVYLFGLAEGMGIPNPLVAGENGGVIFRPLEKVEIVYQVSDETRRGLDYAKGYLWHRFRDDIWFSPNRCGVTAFVKPSLPVERVYRSALEFVEQHRLTDLYVLPHWDAVDVLPRGLDKGVFVRYLHSLGYQSEEIIAVGDALNDIPMFKMAGHSITFKDSVRQVKDSADSVVTDIYGAFELIEDLIRYEK
ncbi:MAG TPA: HAD family hydrolase [Anaerolineae bacterium]|nr:HAD family hydrolase [Anaerolineae bacterium]